MKGPPQDWEEHGPAPAILNWTCWIVLVIGAIALHVVMHTLRPSSSNSAIDYFTGLIGGLVGCLLVIGVLPFLISLPFKNVTRYLVRLIGILAITGLTIVRQFYPATPTPETSATQDKTTQVAAESNSAANPPVANAAPQADTAPPASEARASNSLSEKATHDLATVTSQFVAIVNASSEAESECNVDVSTIESTDDIARRRDSLMKLRAQELEAIVYLQNFDAHCREALAFDTFPSDFIDNVLVAERKAGKVDLLIALWQAKMKLTNDHVARLDYLGKTYGAWNVKGGKVVFTDADDLTAYNNLLQSLENDLKEIASDQKKITE